MHKIYIIEIYTVSEGYLRTTPVERRGKYPEPYKRRGKFDCSRNQYFSQITLTNRIYLFNSSEYLTASKTVACKQVQNFRPPQSFDFQLRLQINLRKQGKYFANRWATRTPKKNYNGWATRTPTNNYNRWATLTQRKTTMDEQHGPNQKTTIEEQHGPQQKTTIDEQHGPKQKTTMDKQQGPQQKIQRWATRTQPTTTIDEQHGPQQKTTMDERQGPNQKLQ